MGGILPIFVGCICWASLVFAGQNDANYGQFPIDLFSKKIIHAYENKLPIPNISHELAIDMSKAYQVQAAVVKAKAHKSKINGFKAGLTSDETQNKFGVNRPISGVLFAEGDISGVAEIYLGDYNNLMIETEFGFITKKPIKKTVNSVVELKTYFYKIVPVVEMPDVGFTHHPITGPDMVAANSAANVYIIDPNVNWYGQNINSIAVSLHHNGHIVNQGQGKDALGDQWEALRWLVNQVLAHGWVIEKDYLLITGALGAVVQAKPGTYRAQFNKRASIKFEVKA